MEDIVILKQLDFFNDLNTLELSKINAITHRAAFERGQTIVREGTTGDSMYFIKKGAATVTSGKMVLRKLVEGDPIGEIAFIDKGPRSATVTANEDSVLIELPGDALAKVLEENKDIAVKVNKAITATLCHRLRNSISQVKTLSGMLPICSSCKKVRDDKGYWNQIEVYISEHSETKFSHSFCPECVKKLYPEL